MNDELLIIGGGALATLFAGRFSTAGIAVTILTHWKDGIRALKKNGAGIDGVGYFPVKVVSDPKKCGKFSTVLVLVKCWQTLDAARNIHKCLKKEGIAATLQNGLGNDTILADVLGKNRVVRGVTTLGATLISPGLVHEGGEGIITLERNPFTSYLEEIMRIAKFKVDFVKDATSAIWGKLVINSAINPLTALLGVTNGELFHNPFAMKLAYGLSRESNEVAREMKIPLSFVNSQEAVDETLQTTSNNYSSMLQDIRRGAQTEIDCINGQIVQFGKKVLVPTPINDVIYSLVKAVEIRGIKTEIELRDYA